MILQKKTWLIAALINPATQVIAREEEPDVEEIAVISQRLMPLSARDAYASTVIRERTISLSASHSLDQLLSSQAGVSLFRRADSSSTHPTTTGISMRGLGANAAGRTLVLLDGMPLNGPFGGWINWSVMDQRDIDSIEIKRGGGAGTYGSSALAGIILINSKVPTQNGASAEIKAGSFGTYGGSANLNFVSGDGYLKVSGGYEDRDGFYLLSPEQRGSIDISAASESAFATLTAGKKIAGDISLSSRLALYRENKVNGLSLATSETEGLDVSLRMVRPESEDTLGFEVTAYYRHKDFNNSFSSVRDEDRTIERMVLNQHDVPGRGVGFMGKIRALASNGIAYEVGVDARHMTGEANEEFRNLGAGFTRDRLSGGKQNIAGFFTEAMIERENYSLTAGLRIDHYKSYEGQRLELNKADGSVVREDSIDDKSGWVPSFRVGATYDISGAITFEAAAYNGFRLPSINEYYRQFRVRNDITESNSALDIERVLGLEAGFTYTPLSTLSFGARYYHLRLRDGVGNVTLASGPGFFPPTGFVPAGGVLRQRENIDESITDGIELKGRVTLSTGFSFEGSYQFAHARITKFADNPALVGMRPIQTPKHSLRGSVLWQPIAQKYWLRGDIQFDSAIYDDDLNQRRLPSIALVHVAGGYKINELIAVKVSARNIFEQEVISALSADGLQTLAQPRTIIASLQFNF